MKRITVFCGSNNGADPEYKAQAYKLGQILAQNSIELVYGGAYVGLMGAVADGVLEWGGNVIGIIPSFLQKKELAHTGLSEMIIVDTMHQRKAKMEELCDGIIALPGGFGTLDELFEILTWAQLSLHNKPTGILNTNGFYNTLLKFVDEMVVQNFVKGEYRDLLLVNENPDNLIKQMKSYVPPLNDKWFVTNMNQ
ncbi:TIGR00730 family Rossman fold protein [Dysgonomonas sp. 520]|nr:TIGR00730 family Rossman fold protein [Dysgonomonas sp. 520]